MISLAVRTARETSRWPDRDASYPVDSTPSERAGRSLNGVCWHLEPSGLTAELHREAAPVDDQAVGILGRRAGVVRSRRFGPGVGWSAGRNQVEGGLVINEAERHGDWDSPPLVPTHSRCNSDKARAGYQNALSDKAARR